MTTQPITEDELAEAIVAATDGKSFENLSPQGGAAVRLAMHNVKLRKELAAVRAELDAKTEEIKTYPKTDDPAIDRARDVHGHERPIENVGLPGDQPNEPPSPVAGTVDDDDIPEGDTCRFDGCDESLDDGEGFDGYCGHHADKVYGHEQAAGDNPDEIVHECDEDCPLYEPDDDLPKVTTPEDFAEIKAMGWSGCMHDSDCACSGPTQEEDDKILDAWAARKYAANKALAGSGVESVPLIKDAARGAGFDPGF